MKGHDNFRAIQLNNNFQLSDKAIIREAEALFTTMAAVEGMPEGDYGIDHLKRIHKHLLGEMYPWAGDLRTTDIIVGDGYSSASAPAPLVEMELGRVLGRLQQESFSTLTPAEFAERMATYYIQIYKVSPFADGNARAARFLLEKCADDHDFEINWKSIPSEAFQAATSLALNGDVRALRQIFKGITEYKDLAAHYTIDAVAQKMGEIVATSGLRQELSPATLQRADFKTLQELAAHIRSQLRDDLQRYATGDPNTERDWEKTSIKFESENTNHKASGSQQLRDALNHFAASSTSTLKPRYPGL
ncbi:hypothetical protein HMPREF1487_09450 [Pseudomonas sp. HPB0071]|uniref:protein adenylyltransferase n=1 Tax=Pseudomonas luteola TaxID=47886 RepID=A0A2X2BXZ1_PSELU|nr:MULTISPECIES: Fic family protein [Pseudomonas]ENA26971.1 hypothetical protein HMPREF1487_09450 [Pseudomonas sp. HPB0071]MBA1250200.1 hypothetical protein [Pseudomonas zeshuii]MBH3440951.1 Fic family protein [Pseudomonas luteola]SPY99944.1 cell filamentation protein [Pseudomonas luteola]